MITIAWLMTSTMLAFQPPAPAPATTPTYDGSRPLLCAATDVMACEDTRACTRETPEAVNLPPFVRIDTSRRRIESTDGSNRSAEIASMTNSDGRLVMHGVQNGRAWNVIVASDTGRMSVAVAGDRVGYVVFGSCTNA
jgi:hypothetical protein